ncbi:MAG: polysaccharide deacetylase family protein [Gammaproteobacteria bacterium]|nr:polysaccharide deacetylase family protein [Gammaproteobacteria bacterium]
MIEKLCRIGSWLKTKLVKPVHLVALATGVSTWLARRRPQRRILMLHNIEHRELPPEVFERQMLWLKRHFTIVSLPTMVERLERGLPPLAGGELALTFDDGLRNHEEHAYRVLLKHRIPATFFVCPGLVDSRSWLWNQETRMRLRTLPPAQRRRLGAGIGMPDADIETTIAWMKTLGLQQRRSVEDAIRTATRDFTLSPELQAVYEPLTWDGIRTMDPELITIGSHSLTHPILPTLDDEQLAYEIVHSRQLLEQRLHRPIDLFCYPNGSNDQRARDLVARHYRAAVTADHGFVQADTPLEALPRIPSAVRTALLAWRLHRPSA